MATRPGSARCSTASARSATPAHIQAPPLVLHGTRNPRAAITGSEQTAAALRARGRAVTHGVLDHAGRGFVRPQDRVRRFATMAPHLRHAP